ncbi:hypothetical protein BG011_004836 [Mortierella polycephala]|uniref:Zinc finger PHD-type domain-containing protein n=1 Tax=Mortierella polycephala TaxID=41804 RepID=A0A9P6PXM2_9FUNG|nr:hypothetical protein BG011_004836 [Mortierella polycephala]
MIQCETCKVWQHCPCVGLGDGEVTPDKYYCDSCRPENHPYRVQNGQLVSNSKVNSNAKPTKKRSTMNSKEASIPMDLMLAQQKWNEEHQDEIEDDIITHRVSSKRRRKTESSTTDIDEDHHDAARDPQPSSPTTTKKDDHKEKNGSSTNDLDTAAASSTSSSQSSSPKTPSSGNGRMNSKKSTAKSASKAGSRSNSPAVNGIDNRNPNSHSQQDASTKSDGGSSPKNSRAIEDEDAKGAEGSPESVVPSSKRRKTNARSEMESRAESASLDYQEDSTSKKESNADHSDVPTRSRKNGNSRGNCKKNSNSNDDDHSREDLACPNNHSNSISSLQAGSVSSPVTTVKKSFPRRGAERQCMRSGSRHSTPTPHNGESTPQPMAPAAPAMVRYPSSKMTILDMTKRAKQLLDYISRVQIDMADRKSKSATNSPEGARPSTPKMSSPSQTCPDQKPHTSIDVEMKEKAISEETATFRLPASASSRIVHGDSQVCPDLSRSSMDSTSSTMDGVHEPSSPVDVKVPSNKEMTIKVVPMNAQDSSPLLSTPPLSVHDHHHHHGHRQQHRSGTPDSESTHEPLTPPHHPTESSEQQSSTSSGSVEGVKTDPAAVTSLELMDKLTGDLIRFQEKFGAYA